VDGAPPDGRQADESRAVPLKVLAPAMSAWVIEGDQVSFSIYNYIILYIRALMKIAVGAGEGEVAEGRLAAMLPCDDMIDVE
jgi:hypothetical protein